MELEIFSNQSSKKYPEIVENWKRDYKYVNTYSNFSFG
jgi:hypothetical protein